MEDGCGRGGGGCRGGVGWGGAGGVAGWARDGDEGLLEAGDRDPGIRAGSGRLDAGDSAAACDDGLIVAQFFPQSPIIVTGGNPQNGMTEAGQMRNMLMCWASRLIESSWRTRRIARCRNAQFSVPLAKEAGTSGIILVTSTTHQGRADGDFVDAGGNLLATVSYPDGNPSVNVAQFARDVISPFVNVG
ncbi:MAG: hypothetical protein QOF66_5601 [Mycobacterium sp.]|nr:hypothetical protein [Mycobacterium sp.]